MVCFPNAKINLGLHITGKRSDGFHNLQTLFYPVSLNDALEIIIDESIDNIQYSQSGIAVDGNQSANLCIRAFQLIQSKFPGLPPVRMHLHKAIPMGAGLGGGSSDASFTLKLLNRLFKLGVEDKILMDWSLELGSDCPFFIVNKPCLATGRGEQITPVDIDLSMYRILIVNPGIHINTGEAFRELVLTGNHPDLREIVNLPVTSWKDHLSNDFEKGAFRRHPQIAEIKSIMYESGALYASMSGSGSSVYGIFEKQQPMDGKFPGGYFLKWV